LAESWALGEETGTNRCSPGIANVCPTLQCDHALITDTFRADPRGLPVSLNCCRLTVLPIVPSTLEK